MFNTEQHFNQNFTFLSKQHAYKQPVMPKCVISDFVISQKVKKVIANVQ